MGKWRMADGKMEGGGWGEGRMENMNRRAKVDE